MAPAVSPRACGGTLSACSQAQQLIWDQMGIRLSGLLTHPAAWSHVQFDNSFNFRRSISCDFNKLRTIVLFSPAFPGAFACRNDFTRVINSW